MVRSCTPERLPGASDRSIPPQPPITRDVVLRETENAQSHQKRTTPRHPAQAPHPRTKAPRRRTIVAFPRTFAAAPYHRLHRVYRFDPTPTGQNAHSESAARVTPPKKNEFEKQTHVKATLQSAATASNGLAHPNPASRPDRAPTACQDRSSRLWGVLGLLGHGMRRRACRSGNRRSRGGRAAMVVFNGPLAADQRPAPLR